MYVYNRVIIPLVKSDTIFLCICEQSRYIQDFNLEEKPNTVTQKKINKHFTMLQKTTNWYIMKIEDYFNRLSSFKTFTS